MESIRLDNEAVLLQIERLARPFLLDVIIDDY